MKNKINLLITTVGGLTSPDILKAYQNLDEYDINIIGVDPFEFAVGRNFVNTFEKCPYSGNDELKFAQHIEALVKKYNVDAIVPCGNEDNLALAKYKNLISCKIMVGEYDDLIEAYDKGKVYDELKLNIPNHAPKYHIVSDYSAFIEAVEEIGYPNKKVVVKPRFGRGGRGVYILNNMLDYETIFKSKPVAEYPLEFFDKILKNKNTFEDLIIMEYLTDPYYSVYSLCENGKNLFSLNHTREWGNASQTFRGKVYYDKEIEQVASKIIKKFNLSYTNNMEFATAEDGRIVLFDLNPRIGASSGIDKDIGFNFPLNALKLLLNENVEVNKDYFLDSKIFIRFFEQTWI